MTNLALQNPLREFAAALRLHDVIAPAEFEAGLVHLEAELERVALDAYAALRHGVPLSEAAGDFFNYPQLARLHAAVDDVLTMSLPPQLVSWVQSLLSMPEPPTFDGMRTAMVLAAADSEHPHRQALARFVLFEGVRLNWFSWRAGSRTRRLVSASNWATLIASLRRASRSGWRKLQLHLTTCGPST